MRKLLPYILIGLMFLYEYESGGFHRAYLKYLSLTNDTVVVMYGADWCSACRKLKPLLQMFEDKRVIKLVYVDVDKEEQRNYGVNAPFIPQISVYSNTPNGETGLNYHGPFFNDKETILSLMFPGKSLQDIYKMVE